MAEAIGYQGAAAIWVAMCSFTGEDGEHSKSAGEQVFKEITEGEDLLLQRVFNIDFMKEIFKNDPKNQKKSSPATGVITCSINDESADPEFPRYIWPNAMRSVGNAFWVTVRETDEKWAELRVQLSCQLVLLPLSGTVCILCGANVPKWGSSQALGQGATPPHINLEEFFSRCRHILPVMCDTFLEKLTHSNFPHRIIHKAWDTNFAVGKSLFHELDDVDTLRKLFEKSEKSSLFAKILELAAYQDVLGRKWKCAIEKCKTLVASSFISSVLEEFSEIWKREYLPQCENNKILRIIFDEIPNLEDKGFLFFDNGADHEDKIFCLWWIDEEDREELTSRFVGVTVKPIQCEKQQQELFLGFTLLSKIISYIDGHLTQESETQPV